MPEFPPLPAIETVYGTPTPMPHYEIDLSKAPEGPLKITSGYAGRMMVEGRPKLHWFVWRKNGRPPRFSHPTKAKALAEARRLAELHPGETFMVLRSDVAVISSELVRVGDA